MMRREEQEHKNRQLVAQEESILGSAEGVGEAVEGSDGRVDLEYPGGDGLSGRSRRRRSRGVELRASSSVSGFDVILETHVQEIKAATDPDGEENRADESRILFRFVFFFQKKKERR